MTAKNVEVALRFKPVAGKVDQAGGIAVRVTSPNDYYLVRANALEDNVRFYRIVKGRREQLATAERQGRLGRVAYARPEGRERPLHRHLQRQDAPFDQ